MTLQGHRIIVYDGAGHPDSLTGMMYDVAN